MSNNTQKIERKVWPWSYTALMEKSPIDSTLPKISIITPSYNQGHFIEETILSVINQNYPNLELIIIDGGSNDSTVELIRKYEKHIAYWVSERDKGQSDAINKGLQIANGDIVNWLNSDDYLLPGALFEIGNTFKHNPEVTCVTGNTIIFGNLPERKAKGTYVGEFLSDTIKNLHIEQPATYFRMDAIREMGPLSTSLHYVMDKEWWLRYLLIFDTNGVLKIDFDIVKFRHHKDSKTISVSQQFYSDHAKLLFELCREKKLIPELKCLKSKFDFTDNYELDKKFHDLISIEIVKLCVHAFLIKHLGMIYSKRDFIAAKQYITTFKTPFEKLSDSDLSLFKKLRLKTKNKNWLMFRIRRKFKSIIQTK